MSGRNRFLPAETQPWSTYDFIFVFYSKYASICYHFRDIAAYLSKIATPLYSAPPLGVKPSDLRKKPWSRKTRMMGLSNSERISMIRSAVLIQCTRVTDRQTDGIARAYTRYSIYAVARKNWYDITFHFVIQTLATS